MDLELLNFKHLGGLVRVDKSYNPGSWDNYAMDPDIYTVVYVENNEVKHERVSMELGEKLLKVTPNFDAVKTYENIKQKEIEAEHARRLSEIESANADLNAKKALIGNRAIILRGKNKNFEGVIKWYGTTSYGEAYLLIGANGEKRYTKPTNVKQVA